MHGKIATWDYACIIFCHCIHKMRRRPSPIFLFSPCFCQLFNSFLMLSLFYENFEFRIYISKATDEKREHLVGYTIAHREVKWGTGRVYLVFRSAVLAQIQMSVENRKYTIKFVVPVLLCWMKLIVIWPGTHRSTTHTRSWKCRHPW